MCLCGSFSIELDLHVCKQYWLLDNYNTISIYDIIIMHHWVEAREGFEKQKKYTRMNNFPY